MVRTEDAKDVASSGRATLNTENPPGPRGHWFSGNLPEFRQGRLEYLRQCARSYGDVVALRFALRPILLVSHPDLIEEVLVTQNQNFIKHFALRLNPLLLGKGLLTSEGDFWLRQRRLVQPAFVRSRIAAYAPAMVTATLRLVASWRPGESRNIHADMMKLTLDIAAQTLFHADAASEAQGIAEAMLVLQNCFTARFQGLLPVPLWLPTPENLRLRRAVRRLDTIIFGFIRQRRQNPEDKGDLLSLLLEARDAGDGTGMTDQQVRDEAMTLFLAGHETTALVLSWTWYLLALHPQVEEKLVVEIGQILLGRLPVFEDVAKLPYTEAVLLEAMRLYPPAYTIGREALADCVVGGYRVHKGTTILMSQWVVQRDPRFFDEPDQFRPEPLVARRGRQENPQVRLLPIRRRPTPVHRQHVRPHGNGPGPGHAGAALSLPARCRRGCGGGAGFHPAPGSGNPGRHHPSRGLRICYKAAFHWVNVLAPFFTLLLSRFPTCSPSRMNSRALAARAAPASGARSGSHFSRKRSISTLRPGTSANLAWYWARARRSPATNLLPAPNHSSSGRKCLGSKCASKIFFTASPTSWAMSLSLAFILGTDWFRLEPRACWPSNKPGR